MDDRPGIDRRSGVESEETGLRSESAEHADGQVVPTQDPYPIQPFVASFYDEDIVWSDGYFIRYPAGAKTQ